MLQRLLLALLITSATCAQAQHQCGIYGGMGKSVISNGIFKKVYIEDIYGVYVGIVYEYEFSEKLAFRPKLAYSQQGDRFKTDGNFIDSNDIDYKLDYLNLPLTFRFFKQPYIVAGPQIGFLLSTEKMSRDFGDVKSNVDYGVSLGFGSKMFKTFFIELNMYQGLSTLVEFDKVFGQSVAVDGKNLVMQLSIGYYFK